MPHSAGQITYGRVDVDRHIFGAEDRTEIDLKRVLIPGHGAGVATYNEDVNNGMILEYSHGDPDASVLNDLRYEMKCLYEFGEQQYLFKKDGSKPEQFNNIVVDAQQDSRDPRLQRDFTLKAPPMDSGIGYN